MPNKRGDLLGAYHDGQTILAVPVMHAGASWLAVTLPDGRIGESARSSPWACFDPHSGSGTPVLGGGPVRACPICIIRCTRPHAHSRALLARAGVRYDHRGLTGTTTTAGPRVCACVGELHAGWCKQYDEAHMVQHHNTKTGFG